MKVEIELDELTASKVELIKQRGYKASGIILESESGGYCLADGCAVRWLSIVEWKELFRCKA